MDSSSRRKRRTWDYHTEILKEECRLHKTRILNLSSRWRHKSQEGLLPLAKEVGIFRQLAAMHNENVWRLGFFTDKHMKRWKTRSFSDILLMTDKLRDMHFALAAAERAYWQRIEGYEAASVDAIRNVSFSEAGTMQQICNAADFLCLALWDRIFGGDGSSWKGLVTFGQTHEFMNWGSFVFAPDYVQLYNFRMWIYFAHEVAHKADQAFRENPEYRQIHKDLVELFRESVPSKMRYTSDDYLATETACDIIATLIAGESYVQTLSSLKYYPPLTIFPRLGFVQRYNRYPMILRTIISSWTLALSWGIDPNTPLNKGKYGEKSLRQLIEDVGKEDDEEYIRVDFYLGKMEQELKSMFPDKMPEMDIVYKRLLNVAEYLQRLNTHVAPAILSRIVRKNIISRLKRFVRTDCYGTKPDQCYYYFDDRRTLSADQLRYLNPTNCEESDSASSIRDRIKEKAEYSDQLLRNLLHNKLRTDADPVDIIISLHRLNSSRSRSKSRVAGTESAAIMSILLQKDYHDRRFLKQTNF